MATVIYESRKFEGRTFMESWTITQGQTALQIHDTILSAPASSGEWLRLERDHRSWTFFAFSMTFETSYTFNWIADCY